MKNKELKILLSAPRGFCAGVERAIEIVEKSIQKYGAPVYVRHEIVHNKYVVDSLKNSLMENFISRLSIVFSYFSLKKFKSKLDPRKYNGAIFLGLNGPVVKSHGGTDAVGFYHSIDLCYRIIKGNLMEEIKTNLSHLNVGEKTN